jgi:hypothetical protein
MIYIKSHIYIYEINEIKRAMQDVSMEFNKDISSLKKKKKRSLGQIENTVESHSSRLEWKTES